MKRIIPLFAVLLPFLWACQKENNGGIEPPENVKSFISAVDISRYPEIMLANPVFYGLDDKVASLPDILKTNGVNTIRLKLWVNPADGHSGLEEVKQFAQSLKSKGFKIWLTLHYSDTWADPGNQVTPAEWANLSFEQLKAKVYEYTADVVKQVSPDFIQIGNEINSGFLHPLGNINNFSQFKELLTSGIEAVRNTNAQSKIIIHFAGIDGALLFFNKIDALDFDLIGLSYYPFWHGKNLANLKTTLQQLGERYSREVVLAETAYPFTLGWNDWTNNIVGEESQLILPDYPATNEGQQKFIAEIRRIVRDEVNEGIGFCYWGGEMIAWKGDKATDASPWENLALFNFENRALPVLQEFREE